MNTFVGSLSSVEAAHLRSMAELAAEKAALNSIAEGLVFYDASHRVTRMNPAAERLLGVTADQVKAGPLERIRIFNIRKGNGSVPELHELVGCRALQGKPSPKRI